MSADSAKPYAQLFAQAFTEQVTTSSGASVVHQVTITDTLESGGLGGAVQVRCGCKLQSCRCRRRVLIVCRRSG